MQISPARRLPARAALQRRQAPAAARAGTATRITTSMAKSLGLPQSAARRALAAAPRSALPAAGAATSPPPAAAQQLQSMTTMRSRVRRAAAAAAQQPLQHQFPCLLLMPTRRACSRQAALCMHPTVHAPPQGAAAATTHAQLPLPGMSTHSIVSVGCDQCLLDVKSAVLSLCSCCSSRWSMRPSLD